MKDLKASKHKPDKLDMQCKSIMEDIDLAMPTLPASEKVKVLEQVIDYYKMEEAENG